MGDMELDPPLDSYEDADPYEDEWIEESYREEEKDIDEDEEDFMDTIEDSTMIYGDDVFDDIVVKGK